jgi:hypothetical protein
MVRRACSRSRRSLLFILADLAGRTASPTGSGRASSATHIKTRQAPFGELAAVVTACGQPAIDRPEDLHAGAGSEERAPELHSRMPCTKNVS